mgnify:CR=1 FL=1
MKRVDDLLKYLEGYSDIAVVNKAKIHQELLLIKKELAAINYTHSCSTLCEHDYQPDITCGVDITACAKCGDVI